ncbi:MAG: hypothetical protein KF878_33895, partial [Planctomycetes bacterium]|nr:hypothetical protein [Planctomycetota bacterium]
AADEAQRVDPASPVAQELVVAVHAELGKLAELEQAHALRARQRGQALALLDQGEAALAAGDLDGARRAFEQALAFDGGSERAQDGLVHVVQRAEARDREREEQARRARLRELREQAAEALEEARARFARGELPGEVRDRYLATMEHLRQGLFLVPGDPDATAELRRTAREFSVVLVDQGNPELAGFILRIGGVESGDAGRAELPRDPHVAVVEADRVNVRQAFGGVVNFLPTRAFDRLRAYVRSQGDRYRFIVDVRSEVVTRGVHPQVFATGLRVRMEDRQAGTVSAPVDIPFQGGPYLRPVVVSPQGPRLVRPFDEAQGLDAARYVKQVEAAVQNLLQRARR